MKESNYEDLDRKNIKLLSQENNRKDNPLFYSTNQKINTNMQFVKNNHNH